MHVTTANVKRTLLKRKALPVAPVKRVEMSSDLLVRMVSQLAQEKRRVPPMWSKKMRPIVKSLGVTELRLQHETQKSRLFVAGTLNKDLHTYIHDDVLMYLRGFSILFIIRVATPST